MDLEVEKEELVLLEENTLSIEGVDSLPSGVLNSVKFEIRREDETTWYEIQDEPDTEFTGKARVAGEFIVRATLDLNGTEVQTDEEEIEVKFPDSNTILSGSGVQARMQQAWADTRNATTSTSRREEGYFITLNTDEASEEYGITNHTVGDPAGNLESPRLVLGARPNDNPQNPTPVQSSVYVVGWFHTHTPTTYAEKRPGLQALRKVGPSGSPGGSGDHGFSSHSSVTLPGFVYDYIATTTVAGSGDPAVPFGHPINASAKIYLIEPPKERPTP